MKKLINFRWVLSVFLCVVALVGQSSNVFSDSITVQLSKRNIVVGDSFKVIYSTIKKGKFKPDFNLAWKDFTVNYLVYDVVPGVNRGANKATPVRQWTLVARAVKKGRFIIPAVKFGPYSSPKFVILVGDALSSTPLVNKKGKSKHVFASASYEPSESYPKQEGTVKIKVYVSQHIYAKVSGISVPDFSQGDAIVKRIHNRTAYGERVGGILYRVFERRYVLYPNKTGPLKLRPFDIILNIRTGSQAWDPFSDPFFNDPFSSGSPRFRFQRHTWQRMQLKTKALEINVKPIPDKLSYDEFLPARKVTLKESWSSPTGSIRVGDAITRTIAISVDGQLPQLIPALKLVTVKGLKQYQDNANFSEYRNKAGVVGSRVEKYALIATTQGEYRLPAIKIKWWNTKSNKFETVSVPERTFKVLASNVGKPMLNSALSSLSNVNLKADNAINVNAVEGIFWRWTSGLLFLLWLVTITLWWYLRNRTKQRVSVTTSNYLNEKKKSERILLAKVHLACKENNAKVCRLCLIDWAQAQWQDQSILSLSDLTQQIKVVKFSDSVNDLEMSLYSQENELKHWNGDDFWQVFNEVQGSIVISKHHPEKDISVLANLRP